MACTSFSDCVPNPLDGLPAQGNFSTLTSTTFFSVNLVLYILYAVLIVWIGYSIFKTIYVLYGAQDEADTYEKFRTGMTNAVMAAVGIVLFVGAGVFLVQMLKLLGVPDVENIFLNIP